MELQRIGLVGAGKQMRHFLLPCILQLPAVQVVAICSKKGDTAQALSAEFSHINTVSSIQRLIDNEEITSIVAAADPQVHFEVASACLAKQKRCLVEKPPCIGLTHLRRLAEAAPSDCDNVSAGMNFRFAPMVVSLNQILHSLNAIPAFARVRFATKFPESKLGRYETKEEAFLYEFGIHAIDLGCHLFGMTRLSRHKWYRMTHGPAVRCGLEGSETDCEVDIEITSVPTKFDFTIEVVTRAGAHISLQNNRALIIEHSQSDRLAPQVGDLSYRESFEWPIRRNSFEQNGYLPMLLNFLAHRVSTSLNSLVPVYTIIETLLSDIR